MNGAHVFSCRNSPNSKYVYHYFTNGYQTLLRDRSNPLLGISESSVTTIENNFVCRFKVDNNVLTDVNIQKPYIILAYGSGNLLYYVERL